MTVPSHVLCRCLSGALRLVALILVGGGGGGPAAAADLELDGLSPEAAGFAVFEEAFARNTGYVDLEVGLTMVLISARGSERRREMKVRQMEMPDDGDRMLVVLDQPKNVRGTALLSYSHGLELDDQWLYLPALKRVKRLASRDRSGSFLGSEFAYEDMSPQEVEEFDYRLLATEPWEGERVYVVERRPRDALSGYSRQVVRLDVEELRIRHIDYYDDRDERLKSLVVEGYAPYLDRYWKPSRMVMTNHQTDRRTELLWHDYRFDLGFDPDRDFSTNSLLRAR